LESSRRILGETLVAVKTFSGHHQSRLPVIKETWASIPDNLIFVSNKVDPEFGTIVLSGSEQNTPFGHCSKTQSILRYFNNLSKKMNWKWLVIVDDDTVLSVAKLVDLLQCYSGNDDDDAVDEPLVAIGERWGFRVANRRGGHDYQAGGAGMIFSDQLVEKMTSPENPFCRLIFLMEPPFRVGTSNWISLKVF
jgi:UDP-glucose:O-linked fucose beta-1,3-glucosyltransferase